MRRLLLACGLLLLGATLVSADGYLNSTETGCDGSDSNVLLCDDFESVEPAAGSHWYGEDCDVANNNGGINTRTHGWCGNVFASVITNWQCGAGVGAAGTTCVAYSGVLDGQLANQTARHHFVGDVNNIDEMYVRWYMHLSSNHVAGHQKIMFFQSRDAGPQCCVLMFPFGSHQPDLQTQNGATARLPQNVGSPLEFVPGHWHFIEVHLNLATGLFEGWLDDCGTTGLSCSGTPTKRWNYTGRTDFRASAADHFGEIWMENGTSIGSPTTGSEFYDQLKVSKVGPIGFVGTIATQPPAAPITLTVTP